MNTALQQPELPVVTIKEHAPITVGAVRYTGDYTNCKSAYPILFDWARKNGLYGSYRQVIGIAHDDPRVTPAEKLRYDACMEVDEDFIVTGEAQKQTIAGGRFACCVHKGSYNNIGATFVAMLGHWLPDSGEELSNLPTLEVYLNSPSNTAEDDLLTELRIPLK